jgi:thiol-disulfide isomerase/thioredoxin
MDFLKTFFNQFIMKVVFALVWLLPCMRCVAQQLPIGAWLPDKEYQNVINFTKKSLRISELNKKLVILDFWGTGCTACIQAFSELDSLQKKFDEEIQIVMVNKESKDSTLNFFAKRKKIELPRLPFITGDKKLHAYFPYEGYPYQVWISEGKVAFKTESYNATPERISDLLAGKKISLDSLTARSFSGPVLRSGNQEWINRINYYSLISKCTPGLNVGYASGLKDGNGLRLSSNCSSIVELFQKAFEGHTQFDFHLPSKIIIELSNTYPYMRPDDPNLRDEWERMHSYNYELVLPGEIVDELYLFMQDDLQRFFRINASIEKRMIGCLVLIRTSAENKLKTRGGKREDKLRLNSAYFPIDDSVRYLKNIPFATFQTKLKGWVEHASRMPFMDETEFNGNIDIAIDGAVYDSFNLTALQHELGKYDIAIIQKMKLMDVLVLRKRN